MQRIQGGCGHRRPACQCTVMCTSCPPTGGWDKITGAADTNKMNTEPKKGKDHEKSNEFPKQKRKKNEESVQKKIVQFLLDSGRLSQIDDIRDELITEEHTAKFVKNWKRYMEPTVTMGHSPTYE